jgi:LmbE family N-acetylglucosaminyl deacetylase
MIAEGHEVFSVVATASDQHFLHLNRVVTKAERYAEFEAACHLLGVQQHTVLAPGYEAELHLYSMGTMVQQLDNLMAKYQPDEVLIPLPSSHQDHVYMYQAGLAACRPNKSKNFINLVAAYEYPSTGWGPGGESSPSAGGLYVDVTPYINDKFSALQCYGTQMRNGNALISVEGVEILARLRGIESGFGYAELFRVLRMRKS